MMRRSISGTTFLSFCIPALAALSHVASAQVVTGPILELDERIHEEYKGGSTHAQKVQPFAAQRGVGLDGSLRSEAPFGWQVNANPFALEWNGNARYYDFLMLHTGRYSPTELDLNLPAPGFSWTVGRTYSIPETGGTFEGYMGHNWQQFSQPEIVYYEEMGAGSGDEDVIYLVYGADRFLEFRELEDGSDVFRGVNGAAGAIVRETVSGTDDQQQSVDHDMYVYWDRAGTRSFFFDEGDADNDPTGADARGQLWKIVDAADNTAYVGHETNPTAAITTGYDSGARMQVAYDTAGRRYSYNYETVSTKTLLTSVEVEVDYGSGYESIGSRVEYEYATSKYTEASVVIADVYGVRDLITVEVSTPMSDYSSTTDLPVEVKETKYRYYTEVSTATYNEHWIKAKHNAEAMRRFKLVEPSGTIYDSDYDTDELTPYSEFIITGYYNAVSGIEQAKYREIELPGQRSYPDYGSDGEVNFYYDDYITFTDQPGAYDSEHAILTRVDHGDFEFNQYFDEAGQPLSRCVNPREAGLIPANWTFVSRDADAATSGDDDAPVLTDSVAGMIHVLGRPLSVDLANSDVNFPDNSTGYRSPCMLKTNTSGQTDGKLVFIYPRETSVSDPYYGFMKSRSWQNGGDPQSTSNADGPHIIHEYDYLDDVNTVTLASEYEMHAPYMSSMTRYSDLDFGGSPGQTADEVTTYSYVFHAEPLSGSSSAPDDDPQWLVPREITTGYPAVPTSMLGSGVSETDTEFYRADGTMVYFRDAVDVYTYYEHENNLNIQTIQDVDFSLTGFATQDAPANYWATVPTTTGAMHLSTSRVRDEIGRVEELEHPSSRVQKFHYSSLDSGELITVGSAKSSGSTHKGPGVLRAYDHRGNMIADAHFAIEPESEGTPGQTTEPLSDWVDTTATEVLDALETDFEYSRIETTIFDESGAVPFSIRMYHTLPTSGPGERFYNYDEEVFSYGEEYRLDFHAAPHGAVHEYEYDRYNEKDKIKVASYDPKWEPDVTPLVGSTLSSFDPAQTMSDTAVVSLKPGQCCTLLTALHGNEFGKECAESPFESLQAEGTGVQGEMYYHSDIQERVVFDYNADAPHIFRSFDNLGRLTAVGTYKAVPPGWLQEELPSGNDREDPDILDLSVFDSRVSGPTNTADERVGLVEYEYNSRGQLYKIITHEIDQSDGSKDDTIETIIGYDAVGRRIYSNNGTVSKTNYDALGRVTDTYTIGYSDDVLTSYSDLEDVDGDAVVRESHFAIENETGNVILRVDVDREPAVPLQPQVLGQLDENDYSDHTSISITAANMDGRPQITEYQYDDLERPLERHMHGTGNIDTATFNLSSPPSGAHVTELEYEPGGRVQFVTDPLGRVTKRTFDLADQLTQIIDNYVESGSGNDENRKMEYVYENTRMVSYLPYTDATNYQETEYTWLPYDSFGDLDITETADHLRRIEYPDGQEEVFDWDRFGNLEGFTDRAGNEFAISYDVNYRPILIESLNVASGFDSQYTPNDPEDDEVEIHYEARGLISSIGQYNGSTLYDMVTYEYDGWGAIESYTQSHDWLEDLASVATSKTVDYQWDASDGISNPPLPSSLRLVSQTNPDGSVLEMQYSGSTNTKLSRVLSMTLDIDGTGSTHSPITVARYKYLGHDRVARTEYPENDVYSDLRNSSHAFDALDRFNRVTRSRWNRERASNEDPFFDTTVHWDDDSNVVGTTDHIFDTQYNYVYSNDDLDRLEQAKRGAGSGISITTLEEQEDWVLSKVGNWDNHDLDLGDGLNWTDTDEFKSESTFSDINELTDIDYDEDNDGMYDDSADARVYDAAGNLIEDSGKDHEYVWDPLGRLIFIYATNGTDPIAEFKYNALGYRIAERFDSTGDGVITDADEIWTRLVYDSRWRVIEVYEVDTDENAGSPAPTEDQTERHVHHHGGLFGIGTGSYIDAVVLRDRDTDSNGSLEERHYYCQNWRQDVVAVIDDQGYQVEQARYSAYGVPYTIPFIDQDQDGEITSADGTLFSTRYGGSYDVRVDANLDGTMDFSDASYYTAQASDLSGVTIGRGVQSSYGHNRGYAGYWRINDFELSNVRYRWYETHTGTWLSKDPSGYVDGGSLFEYVRGAPMLYTDPLGLYSPAVDRRSDALADHFNENPDDAPNAIRGIIDGLNPVPWSPPIGNPNSPTAKIFCAGTMAVQGPFAVKQAPKVGVRYLPRLWPMLRSVPRAIGGARSAGEAGLDAYTAIRKARQAEKRRRNAPRDPDGGIKNPGQQYEEITEAQRNNPRGIESTRKSKDRDKNELDEWGHDFDGPLPPAPPM